MNFQNIKCSFYFQKSLIEDRTSERQIIFKIDKIKVTIYAKCPTLLNATGLRSSKDIQYYKQLFEEKYGQKCKSVNIDNIFLSKKGFKNMEMSKMYKYLKEYYSDIYRVHYDIELFPAMFLYPKQDNLPTVLLFHTSTYQFIGRCNKDGLWQTKKHVEHLIDLFCK